MRKGSRKEAFTESDGKRVQDMDKQNVSLHSPVSLSVVSSVTHSDLTNSPRLQCKPAFWATSCSVVCYFPT